MNTQKIKEPINSHQRVKNKNKCWEKLSNLKSFHFIKTLTHYFWTVANLRWNPHSFCGEEFFSFPYIKKICVCVSICQCVCVLHRHTGTKKILAGESFWTYRMAVCLNLSLVYYDKEETWLKTMILISITLGSTISFGLLAYCRCAFSLRYSWLKN